MACLAVRALRTVDGKTQYYDPVSVIFPEEAKKEKAKTGFGSLVRACVTWAEEESRIVKISVLTQETLNDLRKSQALFLMAFFRYKNATSIPSAAELESVLKQGEVPSSQVFFERIFRIRFTVFGLVKGHFQPDSNNFCSNDCDFIARQFEAQNRSVTAVVPFSRGLFLRAH